MSLEFKLAEAPSWSMSGFASGIGLNLMPSLGFGNGLVSTSGGRSVLLPLHGSEVGVPGPFEISRNRFLVVVLRLYCYLGFSRVLDINWFFPVFSLLVFCFSLTSIYHFESFCLFPFFSSLLLYSFEDLYFDLFIAVSLLFNQV